MSYFLGALLGFNTINEVPSPIKESKEVIEVIKNDDLANEMKNTLQPIRRDSLKKK